MMQLTNYCSHLDESMVICKWHKLSTITSWWQFSRDSLTDKNFKINLKNLNYRFVYLPIFGNFVKISNKMKNTSISLGNYFDQFVSSQVSIGRFKNVSEVVRAGLRLLEDEENKTIALRNAIQKGLESPKVVNFDFDENLKQLKAEKRKNG